MNLLPDDQRAAIAAKLADVIDATLAAGAPAGLARSLREFVLAGGKRIRPQLCVWTYLGFMPERNDTHSIPSKYHMPELTGACLCRPPMERADLPHSLLDVACAWELFHAFLLIHDDIIDNSDVRRGRPSLHRALAPVEVKGDHGFAVGMQLAIVAGDLLFGAASSVLHETDLPADVYRQMLRVFSRTACRTGLGQVLDICQAGYGPAGYGPAGYGPAGYGAVGDGETDDGAPCRAMLLRQYHWKTAAYTFEGPMVSGAILAGAGEEATAALSRFSVALGQAYQIQNDLDDLRARAHAGCDLVQGKRTAPLVCGLAAMDEARRGEFDRRLRGLRSANGEAVALAESIRLDLLDAGAEAATYAWIDALLDNARSSAAEPSLPPRLQQGLNALLKDLRRDYFIRP